MTASHLIFLSVAGLRSKDIDSETTPTLWHWANQGTTAEMTPSFPCVTSSVQASMWTGSPPDRHGVIANGFYDRDRREVAFWVGRNNVIAGEQIWDVLASRRPRVTSAVWHAQNVKDATADFIITPAPIHESDGSTRLWCYTKPEGLYQRLVDRFDHFPLQHYWGPLAGLASTQWILNGAMWLIEKQAPRFHWIYIPHLDYASQKNGPDSDEAKLALAQLDQALRSFREGVDRSPIAGDVVYLVAGEYALTNVRGVIHPNRILRAAGLLAVGDEGGHETLDLRQSVAFAMVDHQLAHVYVDPDRANAKGKVRELFATLPGIDGVYMDGERREMGIDHPRSGDIVLVAKDTHWFAYYWWLEDGAAPPFARTVDIHRKPGYDPMELFMDPLTKGISLDARLLKGSHGAPARHAKQRTALICSAPTSLIESGHIYRDTNIKQIVLDLIG